MGLISSLNNAMASLTRNPRATDISGRPVGKPDTPVITRPLPNLNQPVSSGAAQAREAWVNRTFNASLQSYYTRQVSDAAGAEAQVHALNRLQALFGAEGAGALDTRYGGLFGALGDLAGSPADPEARAQLLAEARNMAQVLNRLSANIADMGRQANEQMAGGVQKLNGALNALAVLNGRIQDGDKHPGLLEQRDRLVSSVAERIDVKAEYRVDGTVALTTRSGAVLLDKGASRLDLENTGRLMLTTSSGKTLELSLPGVLAGGELGGLLALRDRTLAEARSQIDEIAGSLAQVFSTVQTQGVAVTVDGVEGIDIVLSGMQPGNELLLTYGKDGAETRMRVINSVQPLDYTDATGQRVLGVDFEAGDGAAALAEKLPGLSIIGMDDGRLRMLGEGLSTTTRTTSTSEQDGGPSLALFVDSAGRAFTNDLDGTAPQKAGFAGRIAVNGAVFGDSETVEDAGYLLEQFDTRQFGVGAQGGTLGAIIAQTIVFQGNVAAAGLRHADDRQLMLDTVSQQMGRADDVSVGGEMTRLLDLETMFAANVRVVVIFKELMDTL